MKKIIQYMCAVAGLLLMLLSCQDDAMIINPDVTHGQSTEGVETANGKGTLVRFARRVRLYCSVSEIQLWKDVMKLI